MKTSVFLAATVLVLASTACVQLPDQGTASNDAAPPPYRPQPLPAATYQPPPYQPPPSIIPLSPAMPQPMTSVPAARDQVRYLPAPSYASTSLLTPTPSFSSPSLLGPQRADWKPLGGF